MPIGLAIASILTLFFSFWILNIARDPSVWRLWWMDLIGVLDVDADREKRGSQERQMSFICYLLFLLLLTTSLSGGFWTVYLVREYKREKTRFEREVDSSNREIEKVKRQPQSIRR
ncbi:hypothetical protein [Prosthecobacter vanneervenii]|uniref:Transmembrane protein n=1 Tax=Prosthecobacter vanneervenii TaxID=48466 RepID=A0A7W7Y8V9_9BACT|nr:hypothetical protein [Prosthecobacter vanneervenii]MBB5031793.1 hypothetical protein [Prosthecobacter vanneervenii]